MSERLRILLADDHSLVRKGVRLYLETQSDIEIVGEVASGEAALMMVEDQAPDIVLMDLMMPGMGGIEATRRIKALSPVTLIVVLTSSQEREHIVPVMAAGASAYVLKDVGPEELIDTIRRAASGEVIIESRVAAQMIAAMRAPAISTQKQIIAELTSREMDVLQQIAEGRTNAQIAQELFISDKTVKTHVSNVLWKLQLADRTQAAVFAWREGIVKGK
jgi:NarL family two-component system response regulator LiaR